MVRSNVWLLGVLALATACPGSSDDVVAVGDFDRPIDGTSNDIEQSLDAFKSFDPEMCVTNQGRIYAAWIDDREAPWLEVYMNRSDDGGRTWTNPTKVRREGVGNASGVSLACLGDRVYLAWEDTRDSESEYSNIYVNWSSDAGDTWLDEDIRLDTFDPEGRYISLAPQIVLFRGQDRSGTPRQLVHVVWYDQIEGAPDVYVSTSLDGGTTFREPVRISGPEEVPGEAWSGNPLAEVDDIGRLHVVWEDTRNGAQDIFYSRSNQDASSFSGQTRVSNVSQRGSGYAFAPSLAVSGKNVYVVWHDTSSGDNRDIFMNYSSDQGNNWWGLNQQIERRVDSDPQGQNDSRNAAVVALGDTAHVVWQDNRNGAYDIYYREVDAGDLAGAAEERRLDNGDGAGSSNSVEPMIAVSNAHLVVGWSDFRGADQLNDLYYNYRGIGDAPTNFSTVNDFRLDSVFPGTKFAASPSIAVYEGEVFTIWEDNRDGEGADGYPDLDIYFSYTPVGEDVDQFSDFAE